MNRAVKGVMAGALALAGVMVATAEGQAMPMQGLSPSVSASTGVEQVWCCRYGWRGYGWRGYGWRRPFYGARYGWGWHHRYWGWRRW